MDKVLVNNASVSILRNQELLKKITKPIDFENTFTFTSYWDTLHSLQKETNAVLTSLVDQEKLSTNCEKGK